MGPHAMPNIDFHGLDFGCCEVPEAVEARTIKTGCDRRAFSRRRFRAGEVIIRNLASSHCVLGNRQERCARCLSTSRRQEGSQLDQPSQKLLRCGGCKQTWYCSRDCQKRDFFFHKIECKESSVLLPSAGAGQQIGGTINNAALLVRNFLALRVPQSRETAIGKCRRYRDTRIVCCGFNHFDNLVQFNTGQSLDCQEKNDIRRASQALWNRRQAINKLEPLTVFNRRSDLEEQLEGDLRRFRANNFGVTDSMVRVVASAVYPLGALLNHSCAPNCLLRYDLGGDRHDPPVMELVAAKDIEMGEELTHSYVELVSPLQSRRASLKDIFGFDCLCEKCSPFSSDGGCGDNDIGIGSRSAADVAASRFQIILPKDYRSFSPIKLSRWILQYYNPSNSKVATDFNSFVFVDQELILQQPQLNDARTTAMLDAANAKQQQAQHFMITGEIDSELACLKEAVEIFELMLAHALATGTPPLSLELYKVRCTRFGSLMVAGGEIYSKEALIECEHIVAFLCLALNQVPNHSLLGLQLFTLGDIYDANGEKDKAHSTYIWARRILRVSHGSENNLVHILNENILQG